MFGIDFGGLVNAIKWALFGWIKDAFSWLLSQAWAFVQWVWSYIPHPVTWPSGAPNPAEGLAWILGRPEISQPLLAANYYAPVNLALFLFVAALGQEALLGVWRGVRFLISHLPWIGGN